MTDVAGLHVASTVGVEDYIIIVEGSTPGVEQSAGVPHKLLISKLLGSLGQVGAPANPAPVRYLTNGTVVGTTGATNEGYRNAFVSIVDKASTSGDTAEIMVDQVYQSVLQITDGAITGTTTLGSAAGLFTSAMTGYSATGGGIIVGTTVTYVNATTMTLSQANTNGTGLTIDLNPLIKSTGIHVKLFSPPDNGGDTSAITAVQTGGGNVIAAYKITGRRPPGTPAYPLSPQGALEVAIDGGSQAGLFLTGIQGFGIPADTYAGNAIVCRLDGANSKGILVKPNNATFDTRVAYAVGNQIINGADIGITFSVQLNGTVTGVTQKAVGVGQATATAINVGSTLGGALMAVDTGGSANNGGMVVFGANTTQAWAAIKGVLVSAANNSTGDLIFATRNVSTDATLITRLTIASTGDITFNGASFTVKTTGHLVTANAFAASTTIANGAGIGGTPGTPTLTGNDTSGTFVINTGTGPTADGVMVTVTLAYTGAAPKSIVLSPGTVTSTTGIPWLGTADMTTNGFSVRLHVPVASTAYTVHYHVLY